MRARQTRSSRPTMSNESIGKRAAEHCRNEWGLGVSPVSNLPKLIEENTGVGVALIRSKAPGHGMTMRLSRHTIMAAACTEHPMRLRSTLAHELGHFRLGSVNRRLNEGNWNDRSPEEIQADVFARHFLLPLGALQDTASSYDPGHYVSHLVQTFGVSPAIAAIQLKEAGFIDDDACAKFMQRTTKSMALQYGWLSEYRTLVIGSSTPRAPQALMTRATEAYRWRQLSYPALARLQSEESAPRFADLLSKQGITPIDDDEAPARPVPKNGGLTAEELHVLMNG